tara:strand:- start:1148 stop:1999 length:852 start_codon:yes stop_codon:yes gene_type:complete
MSLRKSLHAVLRENGQNYGTDKEKLARIVRGDYEGLIIDSDTVAGITKQISNIDMNKVNQEGFMSDELPKFAPGGAVKGYVFGSIINKAKSFFSGSNPSQYTGGSKGGLNVMKYIEAQQRQKRSFGSNLFNSFKNSKLGSRIVNSYNTLSKKGGVSEFIGGMIDKVKSNLPGGIPDTPGYVPDKDIYFEPMKINKMQLTKRQAAGHEVKAAGIPENMRGKFVQTALAGTQRPEYRQQAPSNIAGWTLTALNSPTYTGTAINVEKGTRDNLDVTPMEAPTVNFS